MKRCDSVALVALVVLFDRSARADGPDAHAAAVAEFTEGRAQFERGDCVAASEHFQRSLELEQSVGARYSLAVCAARADNTASAWNHYKAAEQLAIKKGDAERADLSHNAAAALDRRVVKVRLVLPTADPIVLSIDGAVIPVTEHWLLGSGYAVTPDRAHNIVVTGKGDARWSRDDVRGAAGVELPAIVVSFAKAEDAKPPAPVEPRTSSLRLAGFVAAGGGLLAAGGATVFALLASSSRSDAETACASIEGASYPDLCNPARRADVDAANEDAQSRAGIATVATIASVALFVTAGVLIFLGRPSSQKATPLVTPAGLFGRF